MEETLLSWAIARHAAVFSDSQFAKFLQETTDVQVDRHIIWAWRNGYRYPQDEEERSALAKAFGFNNYSRLLIETPEQVMSLLGSVALKMKISSSILSQIKLSNSDQINLMRQMRIAIDLTGDEAAATGVAVAFWSNYLAKKHLILDFKIKLKDKKEGTLK